MGLNVVTLLPEYVLVITGVLVMLLDPLFPEDAPRKPLGWLSVLGTVGSIAAALYQESVIKTAGILHGFSETVQADSLSVFFHLMIAGVALLTFLSSLDYFSGHATHAGEYFALVLFGSTGMMLMTSSSELLMAFVGLEISSIATYILAGFRKNQAGSSESSLKYFLLGSFATAFFLYGIALTFGATGTTSINLIASRLASSQTPMLAVLAVGMILIGMGFKVSAAPFHVWTPDVYQGAPSPVVGLMSTAPKAAAFCLLSRLLLTGYPMYQTKWAVMLYVLAAVSMTIGNLGALLQTDVKRMLAYSSIAHAGYILVAFAAAGSGLTATSVAFYTAAYAAMNVGAFTVLTQLTGFREGARTIDDFRGTAQKHPVLAAVMALFLCSMIGIPFTAGFFAKFYVFSSAMHAGLVWLTVIGLLNSGLACFYYLKVIVAFYTQPKSEIVETATATVSIPAALSLALSVIIVLIMGIQPDSALSHLAPALSNCQAQSTTAHPQSVAAVTSLP